MTCGGTLPWGRIPWMGVPPQLWNICDEKYVNAEELAFQQIVSPIKICWGKFLFHKVNMNDEIHYYIPREKSRASWKFFDELIC